MPDYKGMYLTLFRATEDAINCLIDAQRKCEGIYVGSGENDTSVLQPTGKTAQSCPTPDTRRTQPKAEPPLAPPVRKPQ